MAGVEVTEGVGEGQDSNAVVFGGSGFSRPTSTTLTRHYMTLVPNRCPAVHLILILA